jgi:hypothetical protein
MFHKDGMSYIDNMLRDITGKDEPFGGKIVVIGGDFKQLSPVVPRANRIEQARASFKNHPLFSKFEQLK